MKISILLPGYPWKPGGGALVAYRHASGLAARGHDVTMVHGRTLPNWSRPRTGRWAPRVRAGLRDLVERVAAPRATWADAHPNVRTELRDRLDPQELPDGDVLLASFWPTVELALAAPRRAGTPIALMQSHEVWAGPAERVHATWRAPLRKICVSRWLYRLGHELGVPGAALSYVPNGVDLERFARAPRGPRPASVLMMYSTVGFKGCPHGLSALEAIHAQHPQAQLTLFGLVRRPADLPPWIDYVRAPTREELAALYARHAVFLCPSLEEGWGLPGAEAMASGCALVSTDNGGVRDYATHGQNALLVPPGESQALATAVVALLDEEPLRERLASAGRRDIQAFAWSRSTARLESILNAEDAP